METPPTPQYAAYPRETVYGSADQLQALADGYYGLNFVVIGTLVVSLGGRGLVETIKAPDAHFSAALSLLAILILGVAVASFPYSRKIGFGKGWSDAGAIAASALLGLTAWLCFGLVGCAIMQSLALSEMRKYGVQGGMFRGPQRAWIKAKVAQIRAREQGTAPPF